MADGQMWRYPYFENKNTIEFLDLLSFKIMKSKEEKRRMRLHELKLKANR